MGLYPQVLQVLQKELEKRQEWHDDDDGINAQIWVSEDFSVCVR